MEELHVHPVTGGPLDVNTYVVWMDGQEDCAVIDPGADVQDILAACGACRRCC